MPLNAGSALGPYVIEAPLGGGGMGDVYRARDTRLNRTVAIKVLAAHLTDSPQFRKRFEREARAIAALEHPHICPLYDVGEEHGTSFLVMQHLQGATLADRLKSGALPLDRAIQVGVEIAQGLDAAHRAGVAHRDLKPANVMLTRSGVKLLDFGLARVAEGAEREEGGDATTITEPLTDEATVMGTLPYMAPEQLERRPADARTDIFALGAVLYEMTTGCRAFAGDSQGRSSAPSCEPIRRRFPRRAPASPRASIASSGSAWRRIRMRDGRTRVTWRPSCNGWANRPRRCRRPCRPAAGRPPRGRRPWCSRQWSRALQRGCSNPLRQLRLRPPRRRTSPSTSHQECS
jgi:serine/threonine protein kinase